MHKKNHNKGYALAETVVYLALFIILSIAVVNSLVTIIQIFTEIRSNRNLLDAGSGAMERMSREIRNATSVDGNSSLDTSPGILILNTTTDDGTLKTTKFATSASLGLELYESEGGGTPLTLTGDLMGQGITVSSLTFTKISTGKSTAVKIILTVENSQNSKKPKQTFNDTVVLRRSYQ
jgi:type II secretory pathway pseudopilin PulG